MWCMHRANFSFKIFTQLSNQIVVCLHFTFWWHAAEECLDCFSKDWKGKFFLDKPIRKFTAEYAVQRGHDLTFFPLKWKCGNYESFYRILYKEAIIWQHLVGKRLVLLRSASPGDFVQNLTFLGPSTHVQNRNTYNFYTASPFSK